MGESKKANNSRKFVGARLELARTFRGYTLQNVADRVASSFGLISHYENGRKEPSGELVNALAEIHAVRREFFYEPLNDPWQEDECSFRHRRTTPEKIKKRARAHGTLVGLVVQHLSTVLRFPNYSVPSFPATTEADIEQAAERCRDHWKLGSDTPILHMGRVLERAGVVVVQHFQHSEKIDAFSRHGDVAVVVLNTVRDSTSRIIFDLAHEGGHLVLHRDQATGSKEAEDAADLFGGAFLMPKRTFSREFSSVRFSWQHMFELKQRWRVSAKAIVTRARQLRLIDAVTARQAYKYMSAMGWNKQEPYEPEFVGPELLPTALRTVDQGLGITVASLCEALHLMPMTFFELTGVSAEPPRPKVVSFGKFSA